MDYKIIADSCCDMDDALRERTGVVSIPLTMTLGDKHFTDDETLDLPAFMEEMHQCKERIGSAAPSPDLYREAFEGGHASFVVTISSKLSASFANAVLGKTMAQEKGADVHVFDSKSASAGEVLAVLKLRRLIDEGLQKHKIIEAMESFIREMKTYFVLDSIDNLMKNGRLGKISGTIISVLGIKPVMGADADGNIALYSNARGQGQILKKLTDFVEKSGKKTEGESMVIAHCNNPGLAQKLMGMIESRYHFKEILIVATRGLSSVYANDKGIVMAF